MPINNRTRQILYARISTYLGSLLILSFGLFILTLGFRLEHMINPITDALNAQAVSASQ